MSTDEENVSMARRALLTEHERDALLDRESDDARYVAVSRVRKKIDEELTHDVKVLRHHDEEHGTDLLGKLRAAVCEDGDLNGIAASGSSEDRGQGAILSEEEAEEAQGAVEDLRGRDGDRLDAAEDAFENRAEASSNSDAVQGLTTDQRDRLSENLTGSGDLLEARVDAIEKMYQELQRLGEATSDDLLDVIDPEAVRFTGGEKTSPEESSWSNLVKGKSTLSSLPGVEKPPTGNSTWRYTGDIDE